MITDKLADKRCYPLNGNAPRGSRTGLTFRERLIIALAGNPEMICSLKEDENFIDEKITSKNLVKQADAIIEQLESEKK